jgi:hypothetical protein
VKDFFRSPWGSFLPIALIGLAAAWLLPRCTIRQEAIPPFDTPAVVVPPALPPTPSPLPPSLERIALRPVAPAPNYPRSPLIDNLNAPAATAADDLRLLARVLERYRERFAAFPAFGSNAQLVNALAGANPERLGLIPRDAQALDPASGALLDRWGTPYIFHAIARDAIELRTAGPDREAYTPDDVTLHLGPPPAPPAKTKAAQP